ncbi:MAG: hypothetical protein ABI199_03680 [Bacteroidia bacterium]
MKKNKIPLMIVAFLVVIAIFVFINRQTDSTINKAETAFAVSDTASIDKIFLVNQNRQEVTLTRVQAGVWKVDDKFYVRNDAMNTLLTTIKNVDVKSPIGKLGRTNVLKDLAAGGTKVEIYQNGKLVRRYYVGGETQDQLGTYMLLSDPETGKNSTDPFIMYIPGFDGYLTTRYFTKESGWRDRSVFRYIPTEIKSVRVQNNQQPEKSFQLNFINSNHFSLVSLSNSPFPKCDTIAVKQYFSYFQNINFEGFADNLPIHTRDSILNTAPGFIITVTDVKGNQKTLKTYAKSAQPDQLDQFGKPLVYDSDRFFGLIDGKDFVLMQYYGAGKILQTEDYFNPDYDHLNTNNAVKK